MERLLALAVGVELFGEIADGLLLLVAGGGEREGFEAAGLDVDRIVADPQPTTCCQRPSDMQSTGENSQDKGIIAGDGNQFVVGEDTLIEKDKRSMFGCLYRSNVARQS
jgi:type IV pilus biogenesis protein CpaD/CtpE